MAKAGLTDTYGNVAFAQVTQTAINTLTFQAIQMAVGIFQGIAMLINRVLWSPATASLRELVAATDSLHMAITSSNTLTSIANIANPAVIANKMITERAAATEGFFTPFETDLSSLPGGGKLVSANPLYVAMTTAGFAAVGSVLVQLDFTFVQLTDAQYLELIQAQYPANIA